MAHVILFTDRAPKTFVHDQIEINRASYNFPAGAYKIASELKNLGLDVLVINNCLNISFAGVKQIIQNNSNNLLWVGVSSTLMFLRSNQFENYRKVWKETDDPIVDLDIFLGSTGTKDGYSFSNKHAVTEMVWSKGELDTIAEYTHQFNAPLLVGGSWVTYMRDGNFGNLHNNCYLITGYAENYVKHFSKEKLKNPNAIPPISIPNNSYDNVEYKQSKIYWNAHDMISPSDWLPLEVARGCAFKCKYCNYDHKDTPDSFKNPRILREEIIKNYELYGVTNYMLLDDLYNDSKRKVRVLYDEVWSKLPFKVEWSCFMRLDMFHADPESVDIVKASGARFGTFGIETLHDKAGRSVGKGLGKKRILETLQLLKDKWQDDVLVGGAFIAGLPYEDRDHLLETMEWSVTTDLMFSTQWFPLWITPPAHFEIVTETAINDIAKNPDKWEVKWLNEMNWINSAGLTFEECNQLCVDLRGKMNAGPLMSRGGFSFSDYSDLRTAGLTHQQIVQGRLPLNHPYSLHVDIINQSYKNIQQKIDNRLNHYLQVKV